MWKKYTKFATKCPLSEISELCATFVAPFKKIREITYLSCQIQWCNKFLVQRIDLKIFIKLL